MSIAIISSTMESFTLTTSANSTTFSALQFFSQPVSHAKKSGILNFPCRKPRKFWVSASKDESKLDEWDNMELKFGRMIGEDPKITLAKIMGRKSNPDVSYLEIEKLLDKKKGRALDEDIEEIPFDLPGEKKSTNSVQGLNLVRPVPKKGIEFEAADKSVQGLNLVRPVPKKGIKFEATDKSVQGLNLVRPVPKKGIKFEATNKPVETNAKSSTQPIKKASEETKSSIPDVILRKPRLFNEDDGASGKFTKIGMRPNLLLRMGKEPQKERFSDITLLRKPAPMTSESELRDEDRCPDSTDGKTGLVDEIEGRSLRYESSSTEGRGSAPLLQKPELTKLNSNTEAEYESPNHTDLSSSNDITENKSDVSNSVNRQVTTSGINQNSFQEIRQQESASDERLGKELQADMQSGEKTSTSDELSRSIPAVSMELIGKPKRLEHAVKPADKQIRDEVMPINPESLVNSFELENFLAKSPIKEREDDDWTRAEEVVKTGEREEVELISASSRGFVVSCGSLIGFLPYRNLAARWKFLAFDSWLRRKGLDPSLYRQNMGILGKYEATSMTGTSESATNSEIGSKNDVAITPDMKLEDLLMLYDQEKLKFLSSFIGQRMNVGVVLADRNSRRLIFSLKPREKEELVEKKRSLMKQLNVGDVVKCCITKITYFGVFVEVEGVPALIHQTEVSWDATLDAASYFKVGQIVDAKVHQLDFSLERIFLSLKEITPDPLMEALEAVVGDYNTLDGRLEAAQADSEWADVELLIKELKQFDGIQSVSKGRYFLSPGLAPTFQVYMASMFENQYKLLARAGNKVQELMVQTSLSKEEVKSAILTCTNRVV